MTAKHMEPLRWKALRKLFIISAVLLLQTLQTSEHFLKAAALLTGLGCISVLGHSDAYEKNHSVYLRTPSLYKRFNQLTYFNKIYIYMKNRIRDTKVIEEQEALNTK